jgi:cytochrome c-type biogenesis protein CcmH/NrfG
MTHRRRPAVRSDSPSTPPRAAPPFEDAIEALVTRARRSARRGDVRRAVVLLRQACALDEERARPWALLGALLLRQGHGAEAEGPLRHARWLRARAGESGRAAATQRLLDRARALAA